PGDHGGNGPAIVPEPALGRLRQVSQGGVADPDQRLPSAGRRSSAALICAGGRYPPNWLPSAAKIAGVPLIPSCWPSVYCIATGLVQFLVAGAVPPLAAVSAALRSVEHHTEAMSV